MATNATIARGDEVMPGVWSQGTKRIGPATRVSFRVEKLADTANEIAPLLTHHWREIALNQDKIKLNVDWERYLALERAGYLHLVTVRAGDRLVGYHCLIVTPHLHYRDDLFAVSDVYFLLPDFRRGSAGVRLFRFTEKTLKARGVKVIVINTKLHKDNSRIFEHLKMRETERIWTKYIG